MNPTKLKSLLILWNSQGLLSGDLNPVQQYCKSWCLSLEQDQKLDLLKVQTLAQNPDVYKALFEEGTQRLYADENDWKPLNPDEEEAILQAIGEWQSQKEDS